MLVSVSVRLSMRWHVYSEERLDELVSQQLTHSMCKLSEKDKHQLVNSIKSTGSHHDDRHCTHNSQRQITALSLKAAVTGTEQEKQTCRLSRCPFDSINLIILVIVNLPM